MKRFVVALLWVAALTPLALYAQAAKNAPVNQPIPSLEEQVRDTLRQAYEGRLAEFRSGRTTIASALRVNHELYEAEMALAGAAQRLAIAKAWFDRSSELERMAELNEKAGVGTRVDVLDAKAMRLKAMIEIEKLQG